MSEEDASIGHLLALFQYLTLYELGSQLGDMLLGLSQVVPRRHLIPVNSSPDRVFTKTISQLVVHH